MLCLLRSTLVLNGYTRGHRVNISLPLMNLSVFHDRSNYVGGVWRGAFAAVVPRYCVATLSEALKTWQPQSVSPSCISTNASDLSYEKHVGPLLCVILLICLHECLLSAHERIKRRNRHSHVSVSSSPLRLRHPNPAFLFNIKLAHLVSSKQRKHNLWLIIKTTLSLPESITESSGENAILLPCRRLLFSFGGMSLFIVNFWCFIWYAVLPVTCTKVFNLVNDCLWSPDLRFT